MVSFPITRKKILCHRLCLIADTRHVVSDHCLTWEQAICAKLAVEACHRCDKVCPAANLGCIRRWLIMYVSADIFLDTSVWQVIENLDGALIGVREPTMDLYRRHVRQGLERVNTSAS